MLTAIRTLFGSIKFLISFSPVSKTNSSKSFGNRTAIYFLALTSLLLILTLTLFDTPTATQAAISSDSSILSNSSLPTSHTATSLFSSQANQAYLHPNTPEFLREIYKINQTGLDGAGTRVAIVNSSAPNMTDYNNWRSYYGYNPNLTVIGQSSDKSGAGETQIDIEMVYLAAPKSNIRVYVAASMDYKNLLKALSQAIDDNVDVISNSWGGCSTDSDAIDIKSAFHIQFQRAKDKGIPVLFGSGDSGIFSCAPGSTKGTSRFFPSTTFNPGVAEFPAEDDLVTAVGGTEIQGIVGGAWNETAWSCSVPKNNYSCWQKYGGSSGGGVSTTYRRPDYQNNITSPGDETVINNNANVKKPISQWRVTPDISLIGSPKSGIPLFTGGCNIHNCGNTNGTSASTPFLAGIVALATQKLRLFRTDGKVGSLNPFLYRNYKGAAWYNDITNGYTGAGAKPGWDFTTGLGSIKDVNAFIQDLTSPSVPTPRPLAPATPSGLHFTGRTSSSVSLAWNGVSGASGYALFEGGKQIRTVSAPTTSVTIGGLADNTSYSFTVAAYNAAGQSAQSAAVTVQTLPTWKFQFVSQTITDNTNNSLDLRHLRPSQTGKIVIRVTNTGSATWTNTGANPVMLGTDQPHDRTSAIVGDGWINSTRPALLAESSVAPGGTGTFSFTFKMPLSAGSYNEAFVPVANGLTWLAGPGISFPLQVVQVVGIAAAPGTSTGHWVVASDGGVFAYSEANFYGSMGGQHLNKPVVGMAATPSGKGYWLTAADGGVFAFGDAGYYGSKGGQPLNKPVVGIAATPTGRGYWLTAADGGVFAYGDAGYFGSMANQPLNKPIVGIAVTPTGRGYWLVGADGGVFAYGDAGYFGSMGGRPLNKPVVGMAVTPTGKGYWLAGADGGVFAFGDADFGGALTGNAVPVAGITTTPQGYNLVDTGGLVKAFQTRQAPPVHDTLKPGEFLYPGDRITSANGQYALVMQTDGNLVLYEAGGRPVWTTNTNKPGTVLRIQQDGNIVLVAPGNISIWWTGTTVPGTILTIQDDRNLVAYAPGHVAIWTTNTSIR